MSSAHLHLLLHDLAILGVPCGLALMVASLLQGNEELKKTALVFFILSWIAAIPASLLAFPVEGNVGRVAGLQVSLMEIHEQTAVYSLTMTSLLGALATVALLGFRKTQVPTTLSVFLIALALVTAASLAYNVWARRQLPQADVAVAPGRVCGAYPALSSRTSSNPSERPQSGEARPSLHAPHQACLA